MKKTQRIVLTTITLILIYMPLMAQGSPPATPIDGGLSFLLAAGGAYGIKRLMKNKPKDL